MPTIRLSSCTNTGTPDQAREVSVQRGHTRWAARLERELGALDRSGGFSAVLVDLDRFRIVSQGMGASCAERALNEVADRLASRQSPDELYWLGSDQFAAVKTGVDPPGAWARRLATDLGGVNTPGGLCVPLRASAGLVTVRSGCAWTTDEVMARLEVTLRRAKERGGDCVEPFEEPRHGLALLQQQLRFEILLALGSGDLRMYYQPIVRLGDGAVAGFEALLRWRHPVHGNLSPAVFMPILERDGLIDVVGDWIFHRVGRELAVLIALGQPWHPLMTINVSRRQLLSPTFAEGALRILTEAGTDPSCIGLEITETAAIEDIRTARGQLEQCRRAGAKVLIDDFGVGSSSIASLQDFPVDLLKIDRQFVQGATESRRRRALARAIADVGHALGMSLVAEGIETREELEAVMQLGCDYGQGFLLGRPAPFEDCLELLRNRSTP